MQDPSGTTKIMLFHTKILVDVEWEYIEDQGYELGAIWLEKHDIAGFLNSATIGFIHNQLAMIHG